MPTHRVQVAAGILIAPDSSLLIAQRPAEDKNAGLWEFPGGKREGAETMSECLIRELQEELSILIQNPKLFLNLEFQANGKTYDFHVFWASVGSKNFKTHFHSDVKWVSINQLCHFQWLDSDKQVVDALVKSGLPT